MRPASLNSSAQKEIPSAFSQQVSLESNTQHIETKNKSSSSSQNSSYCKTSSKNEEILKKSIPEAKSSSKRASSSSRSKEGQYQKFGQSKSDEEKNNSAAQTSLQSLNNSYSITGQNQKPDLKNLRRHLRSSLSCKPIKREEGGYTRDDSSVNSPPDSQVQMNRDVPTQGISNGNATLSAHDSDKNDSNSSSSKLTSNSITARSFKNRSNASVDSPLEVSSSQSNTNNKVMRNSNCSNNNNSSVLGSKAGNFTEYGSICSKEEIKETINLYRSGKARENLITANSRYPIKPLLPEEVNNNKTTIQADSSQGKTMIPKRKMRQIMQRRVNTFEKEDLCQLLQISQAPLNQTELIPQNEEAQPQENIEYSQSKQEEEQPVNHAELIQSSSQIAASQKKQSQPIENPEESNEEDQLNYQSEADIQIIKQVELLNSDSDGEQQFKKTDGVNSIQASLNQPIQRPIPSLPQQGQHFQSYPVPQAQNTMSFEPFAAPNCEFREPFQQLLFSPESIQDFQQFNPPQQQQQQISYSQQQQMLMQPAQLQQQVQQQNPQCFSSNQTAISIPSLLNQSPQGSNFHSLLQQNTPSSNQLTYVQQQQQAQMQQQQQQQLYEQQQQQQQQQSFQFFGNPSQNQAQHMTSIRFPQTPSPVQKQHSTPLSQQQLSQQLQLHQAQQSMQMAQQFQHFHPQNMPMQHLMCQTSPHNISPSQMKQASQVSSSQCNLFGMQPEIEMRQNQLPQETMISSMKDRQKLPLQISSQSLFSSNSNSAHHLPNAKLNCNHSQASTSDSDLINTFRSGSSYGNVQEKQADIVKFIQLQKQQQEQQQQQCFFQQRTDPSEQFFTGGSSFFQNQSPLQPSIPLNQQYNPIQPYQQIYLPQQQQPEGYQGMQQAPIFQNMPSHFESTQPIMPQDSQFNVLSSSIPLKSHHSKQLSCLQFGQFDPAQSQQQLTQMQLQSLSHQQQMPQSLSASKISNTLSNPSLNSNNNSFCVGSSSQTKGKKKLEIKDETMEFNINLNKLEEDGRTTVYIQNIPNKYTLNCVLQAIQKNHQDNFDFFYLPIDFQNKCNVGYAFINFIKPECIRQFFLEFNGKKWKKFNSDKICNLKYARIQGRIQLEQHFQNSSVMNQREKKFKPVFLSISDLIQSQKQQQSQQVFPQQIYEQNQYDSHPSHSSSNQSTSYQQNEGQRNYVNQSRHHEKHHQKPHYYEQQYYVQKQ